MTEYYGTKNVATMSDMRILTDMGFQNGKGNTSSTKLGILQQTTAAFHENVKRAHYQHILWRWLEENNPTELYPELLCLRRKH